MRLAVSIPETRPGDSWATGVKPVVPCFPPQGTSVFLCIGDWKLAHRAKVADVDADPDELAEMLKSEYPGIPAKMHEEYLFNMFRVASSLPEGTVIRVRVDQDSAFIIDDETMTTYTLWTQKPGV